MGDPSTRAAEITIAGAALTLIPHYIDKVGARVFVVLAPPGVAPDQHGIAHYTVGDIRFMAAQLKLAADEAESLERKHQRRSA